MTLADAQKKMLRSQTLRKSSVTDYKKNAKDLSKHQTNEQRHNRKKIVLPNDKTIVEHDLTFEIKSLSDRSQDVDKGDRALDFELARAEALREATIAFESVDVNRYGIIDYSQAE